MDKLNELNADRCPSITKKSWDCIDYDGIGVGDDTVKGGEDLRRLAAIQSSTIPDI